jgi:hypothetical protein
MNKCEKNAIGCTLEVRWMYAGGALEARGGAVARDDRKGREGTSRLVYTSLGAHYAVV